ncbi:unnamed protein product [Cylicocyclus nassatus]|uniref:Protein-tyrosine phosphatase n=1 Tax=Cylicocyclus nassatus TaxID=53992 RepID=A0AA36H161_CYLNA|nr:unnamed protein product [Cylicocyclus nassatus]
MARMRSSFNRIRFRRRRNAVSERKVDEGQKLQAYERKSLRLTSQERELLMGDDTISGDFGVTGDMTTAEGNAFSRRPLDARLTWSMAVLEQGALYTLKTFRKIKRFKPPGVTFIAFNSNPKKNRYNDIHCMDKTRVILRNHSCDYIHANWLTSFNGVKFICTQAPMASTLSDFWHMILQENCRTIIMLCQLEEDNKEKCVRYFPEKAETPFTVDNTVVTLIKQTWSEEHGIMTSVWSVRCKERVFEVRHIQYKKWPDHSAPSDTVGAVELHREIRNCPKGHPIVVHCSAGIGRTCTLIGVELLLEQSRWLNYYSGRSIVKTMRRSRLGAVQRAIQFLFMHYVLLDLFCKEKLLNSDDVRLIQFRNVYDQLVKESNKLRLQKKKKKKAEPKAHENALEEGRTQTKTTSGLKVNAD